MVRVQEELFPLVRLYERFEVIPTNTDPTESLVVLLESEGVQYCLLVDELLGMQQVVIKALEEELRGDRCLSGCAILGDGQVGLILDPSGLAALYSGPISSYGNGKLPEPAASPNGEDETAQTADSQAADPQAADPQAAAVA